MTAMDLADRLRQHAASRPEVKLAVLFGSNARGTAGPKSDVDLGLLLEPDTRPNRIEIEAELERAAHRTLDVIYLDEAPPLLRFEISKDGMVLAEREEGLWSRFKARAMVDWWDWAPTAKQIEQAAIRRLREKVEHGQA